MTFKLMTVDVNELRRGDYVLNRFDDGCYLIQEINYSWLHHHKFIMVYFPHKWSSDRHDKFFIHDMKGTRKICRLVDGDDKNGN